MGFFDFFKKKEAPAIEFPTTNESASWSLISVVSDEGNCVRFYIDLSSIENVDGIYAREVRGVVKWIIMNESYNSPILKVIHFIPKQIYFTINRAI